VILSHPVCVIGIQLRSGSRLWWKCRQNGRGGKDFGEMGNILLVNGIEMASGRCC
jgi:hypothetical protein